MSQKYYNLLSILTNMAAWDADWNINIGILKDAFRTFKMSIGIQGSHTSPSRVDIQLQDAVGNNINEQVYVRVRILNNGGSLAAATNATIAVLTGTLVETLTSNKDFVVLTNASGLIQMTCTDATIETFVLALGPPTLGSQISNFNNSQAVVHA